MTNTFFSILLNLFNPKNFDSELNAYYEGSQEKQRLQDVYKLMNTIEEVNYFSPIPIQFRGIPLLADAKSVIKKLAKPIATSSKRYFDAHFKTLTYKHNIQDIKTDTIINLLDNKVISCTYHVNTLSKDAANKIKESLCSKYGVNETTKTSSFCLLDEHNNKLLFKFEFDLTIHYIPANQTIQEKISSILDKIEQRKQRLERIEKHQVELAF